MSILLKHVGVPDLNRIETYERLGGYAALRKALTEMTGDQVLKELEASGLRGRGGAGFSMGKKASFLPHGQIQKYLCCNADESEPGTFKDRELMHRNPHQLIEGILIAAYAADITHAFIYIRGEYEEEADILDAAVTEAYSRGYVGESILGTGFGCPLVVHRGAGAYICGEETALLDSLEGKRGNPRLKPPFPANQGLYQGPTLINNVETLSNVPHIIANGADWFRKFGTERSPGTKVVSVSGCVQRPGNYEVELGIPSRDIIYGLAGGPPDGRRVKAWFPGGSSAPVLTEDRPRPALRLRAHGGGRVDARLRRDHRRRRLGADRVGRAAAGRVLPPRILRQVRPVPRGNELDREDARAHRPRRGDADGPRRDGGRAGQHHRQLPVRAGRLDGDAGRLDDRASSGRSSRRTSRRPACRSSSTSSISDEAA